MRKNSIFTTKRGENMSWNWKKEKNNIMLDLNEAK